jgi:hypothetical protein
MELLKENWIRLAYGAASIGIVWAAYHFRVEVLADKDTFDRSCGPCRLALRPTSCPSGSWGLRRIFRTPSDPTIETNVSPNAF